MNSKLNILITLLAAVGISACMPTHYYEPEVIETSDSEAKISSLGEVCWFQVNWNHVQTKFQPGRAFKPWDKLSISRPFTVPVTILVITRSLKIVFSKLCLY